MPSFIEIGPPVPEERIFEWFLPYMGMAAILFTLPTCRLFIDTLVLLSYWCFMSNLALIDQGVSET